MEQRSLDVLDKELGETMITMDLLWYISLNYIQHKMLQNSMLLKILLVEHVSNHVTVMWLINAVIYISKGVR